MQRSKSSKKWLKEHFSDPFVAKARKEGYRSRAVFKLIELQEKYSIINRDSVIVDLGAAPGSWSQYIIENVGKKGRVIALDLLDFEAVDGVETIVGDFTEDSTYKMLMDKLNGDRVNCIVSDMLPNATGIKKIDQLKSINLVEYVVDFSLKVLEEKGTVLVKVLQGVGFDEIVKNLRKKFEKVSTKKPIASRSRSQEVYLLATGFRAS